MLEFQRFDAARCNFPQPLVPLLPSPTWRALSFRAADTIAPTLMAGPGVRHFARGRYALREAYRIAGVGSSGAVLMPAYHCRTMLDPALVLGGAIVFYPQQADLSPDLEALRRLLAAPSHAIKALVLPHYFGIEQPAATMAAIAALCSSAGIFLIEDCSHAWQVATKRAALDQTTPLHLIVASPYKFFACEDGGVLWGHPSVLGKPTAAAPILLEAKGFKAALEKAIRHPGSIAPFPAPPGPERGADVRESDHPLSRMYDRQHEHRSSLALSRWIVRHTNLPAALRQRRDNYDAWHAGLTGIGMGSALFPSLPSDCAPYMYPLLVHQPDPHFFTLKHSAMPIWRWDDMAVTDCAVASRYRLHLLHLPCHQGLTKGQLDSMIACVAKVLA